MIVIDTGPLFAIYDSKDRYHSTVRQYLEQMRSSISLSPYVLAELDYLVQTRFGAKVELAMLNDISNGAFVLEPFDANDLAACIKIIEKINNQEIGLTDASVVHLAQRNNTNVIMTLDFKHFSPMRNLRNKPYKLVPEKLT
jgi:hypothetical protein